MSWSTRYLTDAAKQLGRLIDDFPYHAPLRICDNGDAGLTARRLENLRAAHHAEFERRPQVDHAPYHLVVDISDICNLACPLCVQATDPKGRKRTTMPRDLAARLFAAFDRRPIRVELFSWGEPLLNPAFAEIVRLANDAAMFTRTSSHLSLPRPLDADEIVSSGLKSLVVSIDGATQETYAAYRVGGKLDLVIDNLRRLVAAKKRRGGPFPLIEWQFLCLRHNLGEIEAAAALAEKIGVDIFRYGGARGVMMDRNRTSDAENYRESLEYLVDGGHPLSEYDEQGLRRNAWERDHCRWLWGKVAVHADGGVSPCWTAWRREDDFGSAASQPIEEIWTNREFGAARIAAETAFKAEGAASLCSRCAANRAFVNAPERFGAWPDAAALSALDQGLALFGFGPPT